ncbi:helix-turn-helix transcriptional regulator [Arthrobacter sp. Rue61a]|uniref:helix-turn-helix domain-containing protein n=1 Tax=Arthrobacter sp. Rue61a TaxID=1118963 RepID=UPI0025703288|nr:helix-turn-helix transcriptional regulator [Arthrobacter sp. Rue61a]
MNTQVSTYASYAFGSCTLQSSYACVVGEWRTFRSARRYLAIFSQRGRKKPERVALQVIAAICDIFSCGPEDQRWVVPLT